MALPEESKPAVSKTQNSNQNQKLDKREKPLTKVIIRRLPPTIDKETFLNQISPVPSYDYFYLVNGEAALGENSFSRAYINFLNPNDVYGFKEKFDNYVFLDHKGNEYAAVVEFAAFQKVPKKRNKVRLDPKCGTIESDPCYIEFIENLSKPVEQEDKPEYSYQFASENKETKDLITTPLLEFVKNRRVERMRIREERREERRRKELERKKIRDEVRKKRFEEKSPTKVVSKTKTDDKDTSDNEIKDEKQENTEKSDRFFEKPSSFRNKERKFEDRKKDKPLRKEYTEKREFKNRKDYFKESKYDSYRKEEKQFPKKVKKYSERREERKIEAQKLEMKRAEEQEKKSISTASAELNSEVKDKGSEEKGVKKSVSDKPVADEKSTKNQSSSEKEKSEKVDFFQKNTAKSDKGHKREIDTHSSKESVSKGVDSKDADSKSEEIKENRRERIRNKDRPTIAIYRPGMLSKRKLTEGDSTDKDSVKEVTKETK